jgi:hypothetical protein
MPPSNPPGGNYDVDEPGPYNGNDPTGLVARVLHEDGEVAVDSVPLASIIQRYQEHLRQDEPVLLAFVWNHTRDRAPSGLYLVEFSAWNDQRTAQATATAAFEVGDGDTYPISRNEEPYDVESTRLEMAGPRLAMALAALAVGLWANRRRPQGPADSPGAG